MRSTTVGDLMLPTPTRTHRLANRAAEVEAARAGRIRRLLSWRRAE